MGTVAALRPTDDAFALETGRLQRPLLATLARSVWASTRLVVVWRNSSLTSCNCAAVPMPRPRYSGRSQIPIIGQREPTLGPHWFQCQLTDPAVWPSSVTTARPPAASRSEDEGESLGACGPKSSNGLSLPVRSGRSQSSGGEA